MQQLRQRVIASYHLGPMDAIETRAYVEHRLGCVGWKANPQIDASAFEAIFRETRGIPRRINTLCDRLLLAGFLADKHVLGAQEVEEVGSEMREEQGPRAVTEKPALRLMPALSALASDPEALRRLADLGAGFQASRLEARIERLEQTLGALLGLASQAAEEPAPVAGEAGTDVR